MNKIIIILLSFVYLFATGCAKDVEYAYHTTLTFKNESSHTISIKGNSNEYILDCSINSGESYSCNKGGGIPRHPQCFVGDRCIVIFNNSIEIIHSEFSTKPHIEHNLCDESSYTAKVSGRHDTKTTYTYTFTDEDYERAVAANADCEQRKSESSITATGIANKTRQPHTTTLL